MTKQEPTKDDEPVRCPHGFERIRRLADQIAAYDDKGRYLGTDYELLRRSAVLYAEICRREVPALVRGEWMVIVESLWNTVVDPERNTTVVTAAIATIEDAIAIEHVDAKWDVDAAALLEKLATYSFATFIAVLDVVWRVKEGRCDDPDHLRTVVDEAITLGELYSRRPELRRAGGCPETVFDHRA